VFELRIAAGRAAGNKRVWANVYFVCMTKDLNKAVLEKCCKLAEEGMEEEILDVAFLAAKAQAVLEKVHRHNTDQGSDRSSIQTEEGSDRSSIQTEDEEVHEGHNTDQGSDRSSVQTEDEEVGDGNDQYLFRPIPEVVFCDYLTYGIEVGEGSGQAQRQPSGARRRNSTIIDLKVIGNDHEDDAIDYV